MEKNNKKPWHLSIDETAERYGTDPERGLDEAEISRRRAKWGYNRIKSSSARKWWTILFDQFKSVIMLMLAAAAIISFVFGQYVDAAAITVAMVINALIGFITELKAVRSMESLQQMDEIKTVVLRDGDLKEISARDLLPGDVVAFEGGDMISADIRIIESNRLRVDESPLTGESVPVSKTNEALEGDVPLAERKNMVFKGTAVTGGSGKGIITGTGMNTEIGLISSLVEEAEAQADPIEKKLNVLSRRLLWAIVIIAVITGIIGVISGKELFLMFETTVVLIVAAIPEGLPIVATIALARGMRTMAKNNALARRLSAVQTLGSANIIVTDKTGTLTENKMTVVRIKTASGDVEVSGEGLDPTGGFSRNENAVKPQEDNELYHALLAGVLCNNASISKGDSEEEFSAVGDPMEVALLVAGTKGGIKREEIMEQYPEEEEVAFDTEIKMMATIHRSGEKFLTAVKGAPDAVIDCCAEILKGEDGKTFTPEEKEQWLSFNEEMARNGLRVLAVAEKTTDKIEDKTYSGLLFHGLVGLLDPPRRDIKETIESFKRAGVTTIMVTGDQEITAGNVAKTVGIIERDDHNRVIHSSDLKKSEEMSDEEKEDVLYKRIFCRVSPRQKLDLISLYQEKGNIVAMTGDGVNDAPGLKKADIGVAMGKRGQQVAKETADVILQDDRFATILTAIEHGRSIFNNIRKFVIYLISGNLGEIMIITLASIFGLPLPLLPLQILYLNAINDAFPALALGMGGVEPDIMRRPPRDPEESILTRFHWRITGFYGVIIAVAVFGGFLLALLYFNYPERTAVTISFATLALGRLWHVYNMRDDDAGFFNNQIVKNSYVTGALVLSTALILMAVYTPGLNDILEVTPPDTKGWYLILGMSLVPLLVGQAVKALVFKKRLESSRGA